MKGDILIAMLQGALSGLGFWILGVPAPILWTVLMSFLSLLPVLGAAMVWPCCDLLLVDGRATKIPEFVVLISTLGGVATFGLQGVITGPVIAAMFISVWITVLSVDQA